MQSKVTQNQLNRLFAIAREYGVTKEEIDTIVKSMGFERKRDICSDRYEEVVEKIQQVSSLEF